MTPTRIAVLIVSPCRKDLADLREALGSLCTLSVAADCGAASKLVRREAFGVVLCDRDLPDGCWRELWKHMQELPISPPLVVFSHHADEYLWAEVLNLGCYDVLLKPFVKEEVIRVTERAWAHWQELCERQALVCPSGA